MLIVPDAFPAKARINSQPATSWQREMAEAVRDVPTLLQQLGVTPDQLPDLDHSTGEFPLLVPRSFLSRMKRGDPSDPLLLQVLPRAAEHLTVPGYSSDAVGDLVARRAPGLIHKYAGRALLIATGACAVHCRYCFRRNYPYEQDPRKPDDWAPALDVIRDDTSIRELIFSGGDPLMLNDSRFSSLCRLIDDIPHIDRIRIHTRLPIVLPSRVTPELVGMLNNLRAQSMIVVHANHGNEIAADCESTLRGLVRSGVPVLNQAVLMQGINDSVESLFELSTRLVNAGVLPYYLHQLDRVSGTAHFEVEEAVGRQLIEELRSRLPGYAVPQYVREVAGEFSKLPIA